MITIKNTSSVYMAPGVFTLSPLLDVGVAPAKGTKQFATYEYGNFDCDVPDSYCPNGSDFTCWMANESVLLKRWGLTAGTNAWVPSPPGMIYTYHAFAPGDSASVVITASPGQKLSYVTKSGDFNTYHDQIVMMHASGNPADLTVPLFDANGLPLPVINFDLGGYTVASSSPTDGLSAECANQCGDSHGLMTGCYVALGSAATGSLMPAQPAPPQLSTAWTFVAPAGYLTDGMALGDLNSTTGKEILQVMEGSAAVGNVAGVGRAVALSNATGIPTATFDGVHLGNDFMGFPMIENLKGTTYSDYLVSEFGASFPTPGAATYARNGTSATWTSTGYGYPGNWNMGPSAGPVRADVSGDQIVVPDYNGDIVVLERDNATTLNTYNLYASQHEKIYGHAAIADVTTAHAGDEIVIIGATTGKAYVFSTPSATKTVPNPVPMTLLYTSAAPLNGHAPAGSGPAIGKLDTGSLQEIVIATAGSGGVYAYSTASTACKYKWSTPGGADYSWSSPVLGDVDGDGLPEVIVMSSDSILSVLKVPSAGSGCTEGTVLWKYTVGSGGSSWFTPALANLTGTSTLDIVVANYHTLEVLDVTQRAPIMRFNDINAEFYPSALVEAVGGTGQPGAAIYVSGWSNGTAYKLTTPVGGSVPSKSWSSFMGGNLRTGVPQ